MIRTDIDIASMRAASRSLWWFLPLALTLLTGAQVGCPSSVPSQPDDTPPQRTIATNEGLDDGTGHQADTPVTNGSQADGTGAEAERATATTAETHAPVAPARATVALPTGSSSLPVYQAPNSDSDLLTHLGDGVTVRSAAAVNGWIKISLGEQVGYVASEHMRTGDDADLTAQALYAIVPWSLRDLASEEAHRLGQLVDIHQAAPSVVLDMAFAGTDNFAGTQFYPQNLCLLQAETAARITEAQALFEADGYRLKMYDCYRPYSVTRALYDIVGNARYVARSVSNHNRGVAVDATLVDTNGDELEMPSVMHTLDETAHRDSPTMSDAARRNSAYMSEIMERVGMVPYHFEWWHFADEHSAQYTHSDLDLTQLIMVHRDQQELVPSD